MVANPKQIVGIFGAIVLVAIFGVTAWFLWLGKSPHHATDETPINDTKAMPLPVGRDEPKTAPGKIVISPSILALSVTIGRGNAEGTMVVANSGGRSTRILDAHVVGDPTIALIDATPCVREMPPGANCQMMLRFRPREAGPKSASLVLAVEVDDVPQTVMAVVQATALAPPAAAVDTALMAQQFAQALRMEESRSGERVAPEAPGRTGAAKAMTGDLEIIRRDAAGTGQVRVISLNQADYGQQFPKATLSLPICRDRMVSAGTAIQLAIDSGVISEQCPGPVKAHVARDVYASSGYKVVLPHGSVVLGTCQKLQRGQTRLPVKWQRVTRFDGASSVIDEQSSDQLGRLGVSGELDDRAAARLTTAGAYSLIDGLVAGIASAANPGTQVSTVGGITVVKPSALTTGAQTAAQSGNNNVSEITKQLLADSQQLTPVVTVENGAAATMFVTRDLWLSNLPDGVEEEKCSLPPVTVRRTGQAAADARQRRFPPTAGLAPRGPEELPADVPVAPIAPAAETAAGVELQNRWRGKDVPPMTEDAEPASAATGQTNPGRTGGVRAANGEGGKAPSGRQAQGATAQTNSNPGPPPVPWTGGGNAAAPAAPADVNGADEGPSPGEAGSGQ